MVKRFMVNLGTALDAEVEALAQRTGVGKSEVVRHAMRLYLPLEAAAAQGATLLVVHANGMTSRVEPLSLYGTPPVGPGAPSLVTNAEEPKR